MKSEIGNIVSVEKKPLNYEFKKSWLIKEVLPKALVQYVGKLSRCPVQREIAYIICRRLFNPCLLNSYSIPMERLSVLGYSYDDCRKVLDILLDSQLIKRTDTPNKFSYDFGDYQFNPPYLASVLRNNTGLVQGLSSTPPAFLIGTTNERLTNALKQIQFHWNQELAMEYCLSLPERECQGSLETIKYMWNGNISFKWAESNTGRLVVNDNPGVGFSKRLWQAGIVCGGNDLFTIRFPENNNIDKPLLYNILKLSVIKAVDKGLVHITPVLECLHTTEENPGLVAEEVQAACREIIGHELPLSIEKEPTFHHDPDFKFLS
jgi:hypothetical protein